MSDADREQREQAFEQLWRGWEELLRIGEQVGPERMSTAIDGLSERGAKSLLKVAAAAVLRARQQQADDTPPESPPT